VQASQDTIRVRARPMRDGFGILLRALLGRFFAPIRFSPAQEERLRSLSGRGRLVYVMQSASVLHYLFMNFWCLRLQLPLAAYGNGVPAFVLFQPPGRLLRALLRRTFREGGGAGEAVPLAALVRRTLEDRKSLVLFLRHSRLFRQGGNTEPAAFLRVLLDVQTAVPDPVYLVPVGIVWGRKPVKVQRSLLDVALGDKETPGFVRQVLMLLRYSRHSVATLGQVVDLKAFRKENAHVEEDLLRKKIRWSLHRELSLAGRQITGPRLKPRRYIIQSILSSMRLRTLAREMARSEGTSFDRVMRRASRFAHEIAADYNIAYIEFLDWVLTWVWNNIYSGLSVDRNGIESVKRASRNGSLILLPSHKSHIDYLVLSYAFYHNDLPPPHIAAGVNLSFWPLGRIFRKAGAFFIRRTFRGQELYTAVFQTYIKWLQKEGYVQEFFLEGTRSRTGKFIHPKLGMLSMELDIFAEGVAEDLYLVPISISYEKVVEESSYTSESGGGKKNREGFWGLLKSRKFLKKKYGRVYIQFGEPLSVREHLQDRRVEYARLGEGGRKRVAEELALRTAFSINQVTTVTPSALVATVLLNHARRGITREEVHRRASFLFSLLQDLEARTSPTLLNLRWAVDEALGVFAADKAVQPWEDAEGTIYTLEEGQRLPLNFYKNNIIHFFLPAAFCASVFRLEHARRLEEATLRRGMEFLFRLFGREFILPAEGALQIHLDLAERLLIHNRGVLAQDASGAWSVLQEEPVAYLAALVLNFFESYALLLRAAEAIDASAGCDEKGLIKEVMDAGNRLYRRGELLRSESRSVFVFRSALARMQELGLLRREAGKSGERIHLTEAGEREIPAIRDRLGAFLAPDPAPPPRPDPDRPGGKPA